MRHGEVYTVHGLSGLHFKITDKKGSTMRNDALAAMFKGLKLRGMLQAMEELAAQNSPAFQAALPIVEGLLKAEAAERDVRSL